MFATYHWYLLVALLLSLVLNFFIRSIYIKLNKFDIPNEIKTHEGKVPPSGGVAIFLSFVITLLIFRFSTDFPTGTLREFRYILIGCFMIFLVGIIDDLNKPHGVKAEYKFIVEFIIAAFMISRGFDIKFIAPYYIAYILSLFWIVGVTNSINIIDIMDGLSASQVVIASLAFYFITLPHEELYVNILAGTLAFSVLGFLPYNFSKKRKVFLGDSGSLFCGFVLSIISLGAHYSDKNPLGVYAPIFILAVPIFDTLYVSYLRIRKGMSPLKGSRDHFALRLEHVGYSRRKIVVLTSIFSIITSFLSFLLIKANLFFGFFLFIVVLLFLVFVGRYLSRVKII